MSAQLIVVDQPEAAAYPEALVVTISSHIRRKRELFGILKKHLRLSDSVCTNWDALHDAVRDLSWLSDVARVVLLHDGLPFKEDSSQRAIYLSFLQGLLAEGPSERPALAIVLPSSETDTIQELRSGQ
jgi:RNAse (barnase) inhibitor barstar